MYEAVTMVCYCLTLVSSSCLTIIGIVSAYEIITEKEIPTGAIHSIRILLAVLAFVNIITGASGFIYHDRFLRTVQEMPDREFVEMMVVHLLVAFLDYILVLSRDSLLVQLLLRGGKEK